MHRIDHASRQVNANGTGKDGFTGGNPATQVAPTTVTADWLNAVQEELANAVSAFSGSLVKTQNNQLATSLALMLDAIALSTMQSFGNDYVPGASVANDADGMRIVVSGGVSTLYENALMVSTDGGKTFANATFDAPRNYMNWVAYREGQFVAVGQNGDIRTSPDGVTWTKRTPGGGFTGAFFHVHYSALVGLWIAVGRQVDGSVNSAMVQTSPDGITWTRRYLPGSNNAASRVVSDATQLIAISGTKIYRSTDAINWFECAVDIAPTQALAAVNVTPSGYLVLGGDAESTAEGRYGWRSSDGVNWFRQNLAIGAMVNVRIVGRTGAIIGGRPTDGALAIAMPSGINYTPRVAVVPGVGAGTAALSMLFRTDRRWYGRVNNTWFVSPLTLY